MTILLEKNNRGKSENFLDVKIAENNLNPGEIIEVLITDSKDDHLIAAVPNKSHS